jgi:hypothetical protein
MWAEFGAKPGRKIGNDPQAQMPEKRPDQPIDDRTGCALKVRSCPSLASTLQGAP